MKKVVIIGGGLGGLTAGALLSEEFQVTLLEQHNIVGGCATNFKRKDFTVEVGLHEMNGVYIDKTIVEVFEKLEVYKNVEFVKVPQFFEIKTENRTFRMPDGVENVKRELLKEFPKEKRGILKYLKTIERIYKFLQNRNLLQVFEVLKYKKSSVSEVFDSLFQDEDLKRVLNANVQYYNDSPKTLSFLLHAVAQYSYFQGGGYFIKGGSGKLSNYLADVIRKNGGEVITKATVKKISKNRVYFRDSYKEADFIVSNISPEDTYRLMNIDFIEKREIGSSLLTTYIGFSKNLKEIYGERAYSKFLSDFVFVDYSQIESGLTTSEKSFGVICKIDNLENWGSEYKMEKKELEKRLISELEKEYPEIGKYIEYIETGTAKTVQRYIKTPNGTAYGFKPTPSQFFKIPKSKSKKVKNLFFVGQWVIAGGFAPAISSGYLCYKELKSSHN